MVVCFLSILSCEKETCMDCDGLPSLVLPGGKGGNYYLAVFTKHNTSGVNSRIYLKYACNSKPVDTSMYDEAYNSMTEPGFGPHAHFGQLKKGVYFIYARSIGGSTLMEGDTVIQLTDSSSTGFDFNLYLN